MDSDLFPEETRENEKTKKDDQLALAQLLYDFKKTFETPHGQRIFKHMVEERCHVLSPIMVPSSYIYFREGERNVGLWMLSMRQMATVEGIDKLIKEEEQAPK